MWGTFLQGNVGTLMLATYVLTIGKTASGHVYTNAQSYAGLIFLIFFFLIFDFVFSLLLFHGQTEQERRTWFVTQTIIRIAESDDSLLMQL